MEPVSKPRIHFIDALRAYAILMMLQGHFVDTLLADAYRGDSLLFSVWKFMRGMTAPIFFTVTGLVFVFLLLKADRPGSRNPRVKKGIRRAFYLIGLGYLLRLNFPGLLVLHVNSFIWGVDVLHCIGLALLALIGVYQLHRRLEVPLPALFSLAGLVVFLTSYHLPQFDWSWLPMPLANYFTGAHHSTFTPFPWVGYALIGGVFGWLLSRKPQWRLSPTVPPVLILAGLWLHFFSSKTIWNLYELTGVYTFHEVAYNNYLFVRLGHVFIVLAIFIWLETQIRFPRLFLKIGRETLAVYSVHYVLLYGTWPGIGLAQLLGKNLDPLACFTGALTFLLFFALLIRHIEAVRRTMHRLLHRRLHVYRRWARVRGIRFYHRLKYRGRRAKPVEG